MSRIYEAVVRPASSGFGMYDHGEVCECEGIESLDEWIAAAETGCERVELAEDVSGRVYSQDGATIYRCVRDDGGSLHAVWVE